ncbi:type II toxin-antitoxin system prevent-host-death family antitoxin [Salinibacterium sp. dk2585]|uniref:type II toxin-antitoxin system Phd/YefM family antitoxin n=1 Tax=unclassified Salinibacterium TaxID=2632331 RepID=UPI0011C25119|nr:MULTISPECIES: type II toxin-antitoxin system prevent-host-death family antitoxin [unclassified Salinibacterium]QEE60825.1 type II toxin-antitoxin system prevent-host-death family antitoxin [Salinibacterium sp. dk2585]TXK55897.1 type II toxin-antitoxin system prevent-host-death family antitoxin [Salinibacterium sp. dk5596]
MTEVPVRELRNHTADVIERARRGEEVTITVNGVPAAKLIAVTPPLKQYLTVEDLMAMRPKRPINEPHPHDVWDDTTDELGPIE